MRGGDPGVTAGESQDALEWQAQLSGEFDEKSDLRWASRKVPECHKSPSNAGTLMKRIT